MFDAHYQVKLHSLILGPTIEFLPLTPLFLVFELHPILHVVSRDILCRCRNFSNDNSHE